jgi:hypothetical protein
MDTDPDLRAADAERGAVLPDVLDQESFATAAARLQAHTPPQTTDLTDLIRRDRDGADEER